MRFPGNTLFSPNRQGENVKTTSFELVLQRRRRRPKKEKKKKPKSEVELWGPVISASPLHTHKRGGELWKDLIFPSSWRQEKKCNEIKEEEIGGKWRVWNESRKVERLRSIIAFPTFSPRMFVNSRPQSLCGKWKYLHGPDFHEKFKSYLHDDAGRKKEKYFRLFFMFVSTSKGIFLTWIIVAAVVFSWWLLGGWWWFVFRLL